MFLLPDLIRENAPVFAQRHHRIGPAKHLAPVMENKNVTEKQLLDRIHELEIQLKAVESENQEARAMNEVMVVYFKQLERKYARSVKRELGYREMLLVFNHKQAHELAMDFISGGGLRVQYAAGYNFRSN